MSELKTTSLSHKDNNTGTPNITMFPDGSTSLPGMAMGGFRSLLINGDFRVWQRNSSFTAGSDQVYTADRWFAVKGSRTGSVSKAAISEVPNCAYAATIDMAQFYNNIELETPGTGNDPRFLNGAQYTLSFWSNAPLVNAQLVYRQGMFTPGADQAAADPAITANGDLQPVGPPDGSFQRYSHTFTINSQSLANHTALSVLLYKDDGAYSLTGVQLEQGPATPFEHRPIGIELALCQRYYYKAPDGIWRLYQSGNSTVQGNMWFPVTMRTIPTCQLFNVSASAQVTSVEAVNPTPNGFLALCQPNNSTLPATVQASAGTYSGDAEL